MPKYRVTMVDKIYCEIIVEADSEEKAEELALESVEDAEIVSSSYFEVCETEEL